MKKIDQSTWEKLIENHSDFLVFKHSTTCSISSAARREVESAIAANSGLEARLYFLIVQDEPILKKMIAEKLNVAHESPQIIVVTNSKAKLFLNHHNITKDALLAT